jgi:hypothetical protein
MPGNQVAVAEFGSKTHFLWPVAANGEKFLDALIPVATFLSKRAVGEIDFDDVGSARAVAEKCISLAGGDKYSAFYIMLLGADSRTTLGWAD